MPPDVFVDAQALAVGREEADGVQAARLLEQRLVTAQGVGQLQQRLAGDGAGGRDGAGLHPDGVQGRLAAEAAACAGHQRPLPQAAGGGRAGQAHRDDVRDVRVGGLAGVAVADLADVGLGLDDALRQQQAARQLKVVAGRPHGDGERLVIDPDLQRLFHDQRVIRRRRLPAAPAGDAAGAKGVTHQDFPPVGRW